MRKATLTIAGLTAVALLATAGSAQASAWITGSSIKDGTVTGADIKDRSLGVIDLSLAARVALHGATGAKGAPGATAAAGAVGAAGNQGAAGAQGAAGNAGNPGNTGNTGSTGSTGSTGAAGVKGDVGAPGASGKDGKDGKDGVNPMLGAYYAVAFYDVGDTNSGAIATVACSAITDTAISGGVQILGLDATANSRNTPVSSSFPGRMDWNTNTPKVDRLDGWIVQFGGGSIAPEKVKVYALCVPSLTVPVVNTYTQSG